MHRKRALEQLDRDIRDHIDQDVADRIARGIAPDEARRQALVAFGNVTVTKEDTRAVWTVRWIEQTLQDLRYAVRMLRRAPGFTAAVVLTLALGIGANTAIFSLFEAIVLRTLPVNSPDTLYFVAQGAERAAPGGNYPYVERIRARTDVFAGVTAYFRSSSVKVSTEEGIETARSLTVSGNYCEVLGVAMAIGRELSADDDRPGAGLVAVISDGYWSRRFGRDPQVAGRTITVDGRPTVIVGVTAAGFSGLDPGAAPEITLPMAVRTLDTPDFLTSHETWYGDMPIVARLAPGIAADQAAAVVDGVLQQYRSEPENAWLFANPTGGRVRGLLLPAGRGTNGLRDQYTQSLQILMAMVCLVLFVGCANVASLLLARGQARARELAVRASIGAGRTRLARQLLTESLLLALLGGGLGLLLAQVCTGAIGAVVATGATPILLDLHPNAMVLVFTATITILTGLVFGAAPAIACTQVDTAPALKALGAASPSSPSRLRWSTRPVLVAAQIALCVLLASGAGLLVRTLQNLETRDSGFDRRQLLLVALDARRTPFPVTQVPALCDALAERLVQRGDVLSAACARNIVMSSRGNARPLDVPGAPPLPENARVVFTNMVTPEYFRTLGIGVAAGRAFDTRDSATAEPVAVINRSLARHFFGTENPIGRQVHFYQDKGPSMRIVGMVEDATQRNVREGVLMTIYTPLAQVREPEGLVTMAARIRSTPAALAASLRADVRALSPGVVVDNIRTMDQQIGSTLVRERLLAFLSTAFGLLALAMACIGLYGVVSFDVSRRLRDIGVRLALGAQRVNVIWQVLRTALVVSLAGIAAGLAATVAATRMLAALLFDVTSRDPLTLAVAAALLLLTAMAASFLPAHRASRIDPIVVLRAD